MSLEDIAKVTQETYQDYEKIKGFEDVGHFLKSYVVEGAVASKNVYRNNVVDVTDIVAVVAGDVVKRDGTSFVTSTPSTTYYLDFKASGDFSWLTTHAPGVAGTDYITLAEVQTDTNGNVSSITDKADPRGGFRLSSTYGLEGYATSVQMADTEMKLNNINIDISMPPYNVRGLSVQHDTDMMKQAIQDVGTNGNIYIPFSFEVNEALAFQEGQNVWGVGMEQTFITGKFAGPIVYPPNAKGSMKDLTIVGQRGVGSIGLMFDDTHRPYGTEWGPISIRDCDTGVKLGLVQAGCPYNQFAYIGCWNCGLGLDFSTTGNGWFNANTFGYVFLHMCDTGIVFNNGGKGVDGLNFKFLEAENCNVGVRAIKCQDINIIGGWLEDNTTANLIIGGYPDVNGFSYTGFKDDTQEGKTQYTYSRENSQLLTYRAGGVFKAMRGRWWLDEIQAIPTQDQSGTLTKVRMRGYGMDYLQITTPTATPDVTFYNVVYLSFSSALAITDFINNTGYTVHRAPRYQPLTLVAGNANATIANGGKFRLAGGAAWNPTTGATLSLIYDHLNLRWVETARTT